MHQPTFVAAVAFLAGAVSGQQYMNPVASPQTVNPGSLTPVRLEQICLGERNTCRSLCGGQTQQNDCFTSNLTYACVCPSGSPTFNITDYQQSLPGQVCREWLAQCIAGVPNDIDGQQKCMAVKCGNKTVVDTTSSTSSAPTSSATDSATNTSAPAPASSSAKPGAAAALRVGETYGMGVLASGILAVFGFVL